MYQKKRQKLSKTRAIDVPEPRELFHPIDIEMSLIDSLQNSDEIIFQLDDDMILDKYCLEKLLIAYRKKNQGNVFGSSWYCNKKCLHLSHHARKEKFILLYSR